jgi:hypothetical protein
MGLKITALFLLLLLLVHLVTGKTFFVYSPPWLGVRLRERPGARVFWGPMWIRRTENPRLHWMSMIRICLVLLFVVLAILHKLPPAQTIAKPMMEGIGGLFCCVIISSFFYLIWKPSRREVFGIGSPRTVALYVACFISVPVILLLNLRSSLELGFLFFVPFLLLILAMMSARKDHYQ